MGTTIRDVASAANVSIGTVSRALKNQPGLSDATRRRVQGIAIDLGYDRSKLRASRIRRLTLVLHHQHHDLLASSFFSHVLRGVEEACRTHAIIPTVLSLGPARDLHGQLRLHAPDALAVAGFVEPELLGPLAATRKPIVLIDLRADGFRSVNTDHAAGAALAVTHLLSLGRRRIAFIGGPLTHYSTAQRSLGYRKALFDAGLLCDPSLEVGVERGACAQTSTLIAMERLLALPNRPDAVFACNDVVALAAQHVCLGNGLRIPEDIAIVGFDDMPDAARAERPLSTIAVDKEALGRAGIEMLLAAPGGPYESLLPVRLVVRASTIGQSGGAAAAPGGAPESAPPAMKRATTAGVTCGSVTCGGSASAANTGASGPSAQLDRGGSSPPDGVA